MMFRRRTVVRRGPGLLGAVAVGGAGYAAGRAGANQAAQERSQDQRIAGLEAQQPAAPPAAAAAAAPPATSTDERVRQLQQLGELKASGVLTEEEFEREKQRVLGAP
jgi:hypothetical protein